jgi:hypothetical protein
MSAVPGSLGNFRRRSTFHNETRYFEKKITGREPPVNEKPPNPHGL